MHQDMVVFGLQIRVIDGIADFSQVLPDGLPYSKKTQLQKSDGWVFLEPIFATVIEQKNVPDISPLHQATMSFRSHQQNTLPNVKQPDNGRRAPCELRVVNFEHREVICATKDLVAVKIFSNNPEYAGFKNQ